jgi:hypothetical protein
MDETISGITVTPNKEMQLTRPVQIAASQLISSVMRTPFAIGT